MKFKPGHKFTYSQKKAYVRFRRAVLADPSVFNVIEYVDSAGIDVDGIRALNTLPKPHTRQ